MYITDVLVIGIKLYVTCSTHVPRTSEVCFMESKSHARRNIPYDGKLLLRVHTVPNYIDKSTLSGQVREYTQTRMF